MITFMFISLVHTQMGMEDGADHIGYIHKGIGILRSILKCLPKTIGFQNPM